MIKKEEFLQKKAQKEQKKIVSKEIKQSKKGKVPAILELLVVIVNRGKGDEVAKFLKQKGNASKISSYGFGTADSALQQLLGLNKEKEIVFCVIPLKNSDKLLDSLEETFLKTEKYAGICFTIPIKSITKDSLKSFYK